MTKLIFIYFVLGLLTLGEATRKHICGAAKDPADMPGSIVLFWPLFAPTLIARPCP